MKWEPLAAVFLNISDTFASSDSVLGIATVLLALYLIGRAIPSSDRRKMTKAFADFRRGPDESEEGDDDHFYKQRR